MASVFSNSQDLVPIKAIKQNTVILKSEHLLKVLMVDGTNFSLKSESEQNIIVGSYQNFLNAIDFPIQIIVHSRKVNIEKYLAKLDERRVAEESALLQDQIAEYREFVKSFVKDNPIMRKTFFVVVPYSEVTIAPREKTLLKFIPFFGSSKKPAKGGVSEEEGEFQRSLIQLDQRVNEVTDGLRGIGLEVAPLNDAALVELFYNFYNPSAVEKEGVISSPQSDA